MVPDDVYERCLPVLQDESIEEEDKTEKVEDILRKQASLQGKALENAVLDTLWRFRNKGGSSPPPSRHNVIRRASPAPWQIARSPTPSSPRMPPPGFGVAPPGFTRAKSSTASPFTSPRPSPRLAVATPHIPNSPSLNAYRFSDPLSATPSDVYGDYGSDTVDWLVNDDAGSVASSFTGELNGAAAEWIQPQTVDMSPHEMLRSILPEELSDDDIEKTLEANGFDLSATINALMGTQTLDQPPPVTLAQPERTFVVGKSMTPTFRPSTPVGQAKSHILCKYWLATGHCARADCRFSHDSSKTVCKYWMSGNCLAGDTCMFSHDPKNLMERMTIEDASTPPLNHVQPSFQVQDYEAFPSLQGSNPQNWPTFYPSSVDPTPLEKLYGTTGVVSPPPGFHINQHPGLGSNPSSRPQSRPSSRHASRAPTPSFPAVNDDNDFPTLDSAAAVRGGKRHHGKRGHGHHKDNSGPSTFADRLRMASPSPSPSPLRKGIKTNRSFQGSRENSAAAMAIPQPTEVPWLETGDSMNKAYMKARQEAFKHGGARNKFLQSAAQAWNRNDARAAKALSLRGQAENEKMKAAHRQAARMLYEERNKEFGTNARQLFIDLHGLHPEEAVTEMSRVLAEHATSRPTRHVYAITGTGHHSRNGKDKVGKSVRTWLNERRYVFREFSVPGDRSNIGGILGIDPGSGEKIDESAAMAEANKLKEGESTKVRILRREDVEAEKEKMVEPEELESGS
ncbi:hypothetical protein K402DRAFT_418384 [Aulographum hederae CBS 113979]|uniref:CCCH zinc finger and SMR domain-containing protein n=1 Tax=Aulographum hederae CBS 113979 TaxID=1176131 RepID=A0A6G1H9G1_9PEZI|nr:hypothetical protein K402DRAFT_418384 [Aulographum hederae CBS 113979]